MEREPEPKLIMCTWHTDSCLVFVTSLLQVPGASVILFNFTFFNIVDQTDMVELLDGFSNQVLARFDGRNPPRDIVNITADFVILYFYSDRTNEAQGFSVLYHGELTFDCLLIYSTVMSLIYKKIILLFKSLWSVIYIYVL